MPVRNVVFDAGGVLLEWNPPRVIAQLYPDPAVQAQIREYIFDHPDWHEYDRGTISAANAANHFSKLSGRSPEEVARLIQLTAESLRPIEGTIQLLEDLSKAKVTLCLLSNMPVSTYEILTRRYTFFSHFEHLVISGAILLLKPEPAIYEHLRDRFALDFSETVFIDDMARNVEAARRVGLPAIQFVTTDQVRRELEPLL